MIGEEPGTWYYDVLQEPGIPTLNGWIRSARLCYRAMSKAREGCALVRRKDPGLTYFGTKSVSNSDGVAGQLLKPCGSE